MKILKSKLTRLQAEVSKANKKALKHGLNPITFSVTNEYFEMRQQDVKIDIGEFIQKPVSVKVVEVEITGDLPFFSGWKLVGHVERLEGNKASVNLVHGHNLKRDYSEHKLYCEHCKKHSPKKDAYILQDKQGEEIMVGKNCVKEFFQRDPKEVFWYMNILEMLDESADLKEEKGFYGENYFDLKECLSEALRDIKMFGFVPASGDCPTRNAIHNPKADAPTKEDIADAEECMTYWKNIEVKGDFAYNAKMLATLEETNWKNFSLVAAMAWTWFKKERLEPKALENKSNEWIAQNGDKVEVKVKLVGLNSFETMYGFSWTTRFEDESGNAIVWFASNKIQAEVGEEMVIKGTVKKLDEYKGRKQTILTRCKIVD